MDRETRVQSQVESYQSLKKWYLIPPYSPLHIGVVAIEKGAFGLPSTTVTDLFFYYSS